MHRFFVNPELLDVTNSPPSPAMGEGRLVISLPELVAHQLVSVLRLRVGDEIALLDGRGREYPATLTAVSRREVLAAVGPGRELTTEPAMQITLYPTVLKGERFDLLLQKCTEIGVAHFVPVVSERSVVREAAGKLERWQRIVQEAAEQSHRAIVPTVAAPISFAAACEAAATDLAFIPWEEEQAVSLRGRLKEEWEKRTPNEQSTNLPLQSSILIGPEGGYSSQEVTLARQFGIIAVSLGRRILRAETAAIVAASIVLTAFDDLGLKRVILEIELKEVSSLRKSQRKSGGFISVVTPNSPAARVGIQPGDRLLAIDGRPVKDIVAVRYYQSEGDLSLKVLKQGDMLAQDVLIRKDYAEDIGIDFDDPTFDGIKRCNNHCLFCFVDQMAPRFRHSLYIKDDDYRYSFLYGNFVTMTNLKDEDWQRIDEERLTPLYFSVHATEMECRRYIMGNPRVPDPIEQLKRMASINVQAHTQIVLCPDVNDGAQLERSVFDLAAMYPTVQSIGIVPVGLTKYRTRYNEVMRSYTPEEAKAVIAQVEPWQRKLKQQTGKHLVHLSDEWYLLTGQELPKAATYDGFTQLENGVGMVRQLLDDHARTLRRWQKKHADRQPGSRKKVRLVTATMMGATLRGLADELSATLPVQADVLVLENELFGPQVTVAGLLTGAQVIRELKASDLSGVDAVFIPDTMFSITEPHRTLDEMTLEQINAELGLPVYPVQSFSEVVDFLQLV